MKSRRPKFLRRLKKTKTTLTNLSAPGMGPHLLLACALTEKTDLGYFAAQDVREPMRKITGKGYEIPSFAQHLNDFCDPKRGPILQKTGSPRLYRYRFINPLFQPFVIMQGIQKDRISSTMLEG